LPFENNFLKQRCHTVFFAAFFIPDKKEFLLLVRNAIFVPHEPVPIAQYRYPEKFSPVTDGFSFMPRHSWSVGLGHMDQALWILFPMLVQL